MEENVKGLVALWNLIELGYDLNLKYADTGIISGNDEGVVVDIAAIEGTANQWNEPIQQFDMEGAFVLRCAAELVNEYMQEPAGYKRGIDIPLVKLIGDRPYRFILESKSRLIANLISEPVASNGSWLFFYPIQEGVWGNILERWRL